MKKCNKNAARAASFFFTLCFFLTIFERPRESQDYLLVVETCIHSALAGGIGLTRDVYGVRTAPRSGCLFFIVLRSGYTPVGKVTDYYGAVIRRYESSAFKRSGYPPLIVSRSRADFSSVFRSGADIRHYKFHGLLRGGSSPHMFFTGRFISLRRANRTNPGISSRCAVAVLRRNDTVDCENVKDIRE